MEGNEKVTKDNWAGGVQIEDMPDAGKYTNAIRVNKPFPIAKFPIMTANKAYDYVLAHAGAILPKRDPVDKRIVEDVRTGKITYNEKVQPYAGSKFIKRRLPADSYKQGIISDISQVGGYPEYKGTPYKDTDADGLPDAWEIKHKLNPGNAKDASMEDKNHDGYTNIEKYLNEVADRGN